MTQAFGDKVDSAMQTAAPILPIIIIGRQPYRLARPDTIGPRKIQQQQPQFISIDLFNMHLSLTD